MLSHFFFIYFISLSLNIRRSIRWVDNWNIFGTIFLVYIHVFQAAPYFMMHSGRKCFFLNAIFFVFGRNGALFDLYDPDGWILVEPIKATRGQTILLDYKQSSWFTNFFSSWAKENFFSRQGDVARDDSQRPFDHSKHCRNNVATLCCAKNRRCESSRVSLVPRRSLVPRCPREVWERAGERTRLSVTSQLTVESRIDRAENA